MAGVSQCHLLVHFLQGAVVLFLLVQRYHTPALGTECDAFEEMVHAFASNNTHALQRIVWRAEVLRWPNHTQALAARLLALLQVKLMEQKNEAEAKKQCRWKTYTGDNLDELLPVLAKHYNMSSLLDKQFWADAASYPARVNARYMPNGTSWIESWNNYHTVDISDCDEITPECLIWKHPSINTSQTPTDRTYRKCCIEHHRLLETLRYTLEVMTSVGIRPWLGMGSLLASVRHNGVFIGWDTDVDIYIREEDVPKLKAAFKNTHTTKHWFAIDPQTDMGMQKRDMFYIYYTRKRTKGGSHVEVWVWNTRRMDVHKYDPLVFPLVPCQLYDLDVYCPKESAKMLEIWYSKSWWKYKFTLGKTTLMLT
eukprot:GGOE01061642.1.p1 GENE.GGOE01061642.1~~GGOE01061642.1.p1  ORF type:complete len:367 (+),score=102.75 GGOE01061642.1:32-1132(+)